MKWRRILAFCLSACLAIPSASLHANAQSTSQSAYLNTQYEMVKGNLDITILLNYPITAKENDLFISLKKDGQAFTDEIPLGNQELLSFTAKDNITYQAKIAMLDKTGRTVDFGGECSYVNITFEEIPSGFYEVTFSGKGFKSYTSNVEISNFSKHLIVCNNNNTFTAGDLNADGNVDEADLRMLKEQLAKQTNPNDLNRDGTWDVLDYLYLYNNMDATGGEILQNTSMIPESTLDWMELEDFMKTEYQLDTEQIKGLFNTSDSNQAVEFSKNDSIISEENPLAIEVPFNEETAKETEIQYISLSVPQADDSAIKSGFVTCETVDGEIIEIPFGETETPVLKAQSFAAPTAATEERRTITINLLKRVAIKKVTIQVTGTQKDSKLASIAKIEFLQELSTTSQEEINRVKNVTAKAGDKTVTLTWTGIPNVTGYQIKYGTEPGIYTNSLTADSCSAKIEGLTNDTTYYFTVYGINGSWVGPPSTEISAVPVEAAAPGRVGGVAVTEGDEILNISWGSMKNTDYYNLYYKEADSNENYQKVTDIKTNSFVLAGLKNDVTYHLCVSAVNVYGEGSKSPLAEGTPVRIEVAEPKGIPTYNLLPNSVVTNIKLTHPDHYDKNLYPNGFDPKTVIDNDYRTAWTARGNYWENQGFVVTFDQAYDMNHLVWVTRLDQDKYMKTINRYYVEVWGEEDDLSKPGTIVVSFGTYLAKNPLSKDGVEILTFPKSSVRKIKVTTKMSDGGPALPSASELRFYEYYDLADEVSALFADDLHTKLSSKGTRENIDKLRQRISGETGEFYVDKNILIKELDLADTLLSGGEVTGIITAETGRNAALDTSRNFSYTLNDMQPIGYTAKAGEDLIVYVQSADKVLPQLVMTQYAGEASAWSQTVSLKEGRNIITVPKIGSGVTERGGSLYITYKGSKEDTRLHILGGKKMPVLNLPDFTFEEEETAAQKAAVIQAVKEYIKEIESYTIKIANKNKLETSVENSTEIATKHVLLSVSAAAVQNRLKGFSNLDDKAEAIYQTLCAWEKNMEVHYTVCGLSTDAAEVRDQLPSSRINIRYMTMTGKAFMYAGGAHIGIQYGSCKEAVSGSMPAPSKAGLFGWGLNHEIGHVLDQGGLTYPETTNNIHSLFSQTYDGVNNTGTSRLEGGTYDSVYSKVSKSTPGKSSNVFVQLAMYWQLHLAYDKGGEDSFTFYQKLYQQLRNTPASERPSDKDMLFIRLACDTAKKDLTDFFEHWGMTLTEDTLSYIREKGYEKEERAIYYLNDEARRYCLDKNGQGFGSTASGSALSVTAVPAGQNSNSVKIQVALPSAISKDSVLGYEIKRNGKTIAFTTNIEEDFVDESLAVNNIELNYTVTAYDKLLGTISGSTTYRIASDAAIDNQTWDYTVSGSAITFTMDAAMDISGIKIVEPSPANWQSITGTAVIGEKTTPVSLSYAGRNSEDTASIYYFDHPDAPTNDGRIWTYHTNCLTVENSSFTGLTDSEAKEKLYAVSYPGDDISFYQPKEQNTIGILKEDYIDPDSNTVLIPAGTVIVVGTYRGDAMYNVVKLWGNYSKDPDEGSDETDTGTNEPVLIGGDQYLFAEVPNDRVMTNISNGIWIYIPAISEGDRLPDEIKAELYRVDNPDTLEGERLVSNTAALPVPNYDTLPYISLSNTQVTGQ